MAAWSEVRRSAAYAVGWKAVGVLLSLVFGAVLTRCLPQGDVGAFFLLASTASAISIGATLGLPQALTRFVACSEFDDLGVTEIGSSFVRIAVPMLLVSLGLAAIGLHEIHGSSAWQMLGATGAKLPFWLIMSAAAAMSFRQVAAETLRGCRRIGWATFVGGAALSGGALALGICTVGIVLVSLIYKSPTIVHAGAVLVIAWGLTAAVGALVARSAFDLSLRSKPGHAALLLRTGVPIALATAVQLALTQGGLWAAAGYASDFQVALYGASARVSVLFFAPVAVASSVLAPWVAALSQRGEKDQLRSLVRGSATVLALVTAPAFAIVLVFPREVLGLVFGPEYSVGGGVLAALVTGQLTAVLAGPCNLALLMSGGERAVLLINAIAGSLLVGLVMLLAPRHGIQGVAVAVASTTALQYFMLAFAARLSLGFWTAIDPRPGSVSGFIEELRS